MADVNDPEIRDAIFDVRDDTTDTDWVALGYKKKTTIKVVAKGNTGHAGLMEICTPDALLFCLLRLIDGDQESRRVKFIGLTFVGEDVGGMQRGRVATHKGSIFRLCGQMNIEVQADNHAECSMELLLKKLKVAGGADYDTGSNAGGYRSQAKTIREKSLQAYKTREKFGNVTSVVYTEHALPQSTPVDLGGRPMVASASEAKKNTKDSVLDTDKFKGKAATYTPKPGSAKPSPTKPKPSPNKPKLETDEEAEARKRSAEILAEVMAEQEAAEAAERAEREASAALGADDDDAAAGGGEKPSGEEVEEAEARKRSAEILAEVMAEQEAEQAQAQAEAEPEPVAVAASGKDELSDDPEERARQRAEKRKARREAAAKKAREEVAAFKSSLAAEDAAPEEEAAAPEPEAEPAAAPKQEKKKASLFDDVEDDDDDLFSKPAAAAKPAPPPEEEEEEEDLPPGPVSPEADKGDVTLPFGVLKKLLVDLQFVTEDYDGTADELAQKIKDEVAH